MLDVEETILQKSYDDNWDLVGYTSELRDRNGNFYAIVDFNADDVGKIRYCLHCLEYGFQYKLGAKIRKKGEPRAPDDDQFLSCYECGNTFPTHETHFESKIKKNSVLTTKNPFENESIFLSTDRGATQRRKGKKRKTRFKIGDHEDPEIQAEINKGNTVRIIHNS